MVGGLRKKLYLWVVKKPIRAGFFAALLSMPYSCYNAYNIIRDPKPLFGQDPWDALYEVLPGVLPMLSFSVGGILAYILNTFTYEDKFNPKARLGDFNKRKQIKKELAKINFESLVDKTYHLIKSDSSLKTYFNDVKLSLILNEDKKSAFAKAKQDPAAYMDAAFNYFLIDKYDDALIQMSKILELRKALPWICILDIHYMCLTHKLDICLNPRDPTRLSWAAMLEIFKQKYSRALYYSTFARKTAEIFDSPLKKEAFCLDALVHHSLNARNSKDVWANFIRELKKEPVLERIAETKNPVRTLKGSRFLSKTIVLKDKKNKEDLDAEKDLTTHIKRIIGDTYDVAEPIYITDVPIEGMYTYMMRHAEGQTLLEKFKQKDYFALPAVVGCLALIHARMPENIVRKGKLRIPLKLKRKLFDPDIALPRGLARAIINNYRPVYNTFKDAVYVYNKDAHPENWLVSDKITVLDCENEFLVPAQFDLVNLLEYSDYLTDKQKDAAIADYVGAYNKHSGKNLNLHEFKLIYFNAVINRAISLCVAWSSKDRPTMHSERAKIIANAIHAIGRLKEEFTQYYECNAENYLVLQDSLVKIKELVGV